MQHIISIPWYEIPFITVERTVQIEVLHGRINVCHQNIVGKPCNIVIPINIGTNDIVDIHGTVIDHFDQIQNLCMVFPAFAAEHCFKRSLIIGWIIHRFQYIRHFKIETDCLIEVSI